MRHLTALAALILILGPGAGCVPEDDVETDDDDDTTAPVDDDDTSDDDDTVEAEPGTAVVARANDGEDLYGGSAAIGPDGAVYVVWVSVIDELRDVWLAVSSDSGETFGERLPCEGRNLVTLARVEHLIQLRKDLYPAYSTIPTLREEPIARRESRQP